MTNPLHRRQGTAFRAFFHFDITSGVFGVEFPDLPGCVASGEGFVQARDDAKRALDLWIDDSLNRGESVPAPPVSREPRRPAGAAIVWISSRSGFDQERRRARGEQSARST